MLGCNFSFGQTSVHASVPFVLLLHVLVLKIPTFWLEKMNFSVSVCTHIFFFFFLCEIFIYPLGNHCYWSQCMTREVRGVVTAVEVLKCGMKTYMSLRDCPVITRSNQPTLNSRSTIRAPLQKLNIPDNCAKVHI